jgi:uncharacterized protein YbbK (DUF523 family)
MLLAACPIAALGIPPPRPPARMTAAREPHEDRRRHMLDLAATYRRAADTLALTSE